MQNVTPPLAPAPPATAKRHTGRWIAAGLVIVAFAALAGGNDPAPAAARADRIVNDPAPAAAVGCVDIEAAMIHADALETHLTEGQTAAESYDLDGAATALGAASDDAYAIAADYSAEPAAAAIWLDVAAELHAGERAISTLDVTGATAHLTRATAGIGEATDMLTTDPPAVC